MLDRGLKTMHQCVIGFGFASTGLSVTWHSTKFHSSFAQPFFGRVICWIPAFAGMTNYLNRMGLQTAATWDSRQSLGHLCLRLTRYHFRHLHQKEGKAGQIGREMLFIKNIFAQLR